VVVKKLGHRDIRIMRALRFDDRNEDDPLRGELVVESFHHGHCSLAGRAPRSHEF